ncbi:MAG TPA: amidohydrolase [Bacteroidales bacterium]|mgnify:CR=1 FL=1|nr:amidohydrolase [Bacteroidales bacterium]
MQDITITIVQSDLAWEQPLKNLDNFDKKLEPLKNCQDVIVLPEMFSTAFTMDVQQFAEEMDGTVLLWMKEKAISLNSVISGSFIFKNKEAFYNRLVWMKPDGTYNTYDKRHLFRFGNEHNFFKAGTEKIIVELNGWNICPMICYDLRFPVWAKNNYNNGHFQYDVLIYIANWPEARKLHWQTLLKARAIENLSYVVGVNRIGGDGRGTRHSGNSMIISPRGETLCEMADHTEDVKTIMLKKSELLQYRDKFNVAPDWDEFQLI